MLHDTKLCEDYLVSKSEFREEKEEGEGGENSFQIKEGSEEERGIETASPREPRTRCL